MGYSYSGVMKGLKEFYFSMRKLCVEIGNFEHEYNAVISDAIVDTRNSNGWKLIFIKRGGGDILEIKIQRGYRFAIEGSDAYDEFRKYFGIGGGKGSFSVKDFVNHLNGQIPLTYNLGDENRRAILHYDKLDKESDGIYPIGIKNWEVIHAKNPEMPLDKYHRTPKNLAKTKELYPEIYQSTKDMDITIIYGVEPGEKTRDIKLRKW